MKYTVRLLNTCIEFPVKTDEDIVDLSHRFKIPLDRLVPVFRKRKLKDGSTIFFHLCDNPLRLVSVAPELEISTTIPLRGIEDRILACQAATYSFNKKIDKIKLKD